MLLQNVMGKFKWPQLFRNGGQIRKSGGKSRIVGHWNDMNHFNNPILGSAVFHGGACARRNHALGRRREK